MNTQSDADLRKAISEILVKWDMPTRQVAISEIMQLFHSYKQQVLDELLAKAVEVQTVQYTYDNGDKVIAAFTNSAIPVSVVHQVIAEMKQRAALTGRKEQS